MFRIRMQEKSTDFRIHPNPIKPKEKSENLLDIFRNFWRIYFLNSSLHGVKYISDRKSRPFERLIWSILVITAIIFTTIMCLTASSRFRNSPLKTVVETEHYPIFNIYFPATTICNYNHINWLKISGAKLKFIPNATVEIEKLFEDFVKAFEIFEFGSFERFDVFSNTSLEPLDHFRVYDLIKYMRHDCTELFPGPCSWGNKRFNCCEVISEHASEFGLCWSFNSVVSEEGLQKSSYPFRAYTAGPKAGLRLSIKLNPDTRIPDSKNSPGIQIIIHNPREWPTSAYVIPGGTSTLIEILSTFSYALPATRRIRSQYRHCIFEDEAKSLHTTLPGLAYLRNNCESECRQLYTLKYCNCTLDILFRTEIFNFQKPLVPSKFFPESEPGMTCDCPSECNRITYNMQANSNQILRSSNYSSIIHLDIHFQDSVIIKYRTDVVYDFIDLMVSFGGIAGLFMGSSLLSVAEYIYHITLGFALLLIRRMS